MLDPRFMMLYNIKANWTYQKFERRTMNREGCRNGMPINNAFKGITNYDDEHNSLRINPALRHDLPPDGI